ncbi:hypothetical protein SASPL_142177 [Salvia splendens]|uniref:Glutaredoxin domain-containing protein n=1 Tax=Salvia splendens TaxID=180675 RepID=A0A8X8WL63_SALSN|nr:uncharacterized protein At3g28850-like [Salvia splendens]KAG6396039.1 hypothetical protein SASPL_142177 [Salvia splendens]
MGCATSKPKVCRSCHRPYSPVRRSYSMHVHHPPQKTGDSYHLVALTSSTLGSLKLDPLIQTLAADKSTDDRNQKPSIEDAEREKEKEKEIIPSVKEEFAMGMIEAKTWSHMIDSKIPKLPPMTPVITPPGEPETIDAWEMMEGLEDSSPLRPAHFRSFSFHVGAGADDQPTPRVKEISSDGDTETSSNDTSIVSEFDSGVIATLRKALVDLPPANPFHLQGIGEDEKQSEKEEKDKLIVYFTSLRGVRKTYEDCCHVRVMLKGLGVKVDERDVSMHSGFKEELKTALLAAEAGGIGLPSVFLGGKLVGGADEIRRLNEEGMLGKLVENCEPADDGGLAAGCEACGDVRFVPCETCSGSCKIYYDADSENIDADEDEDGNDGDDDDEECGFKRCPDCNENGLIRCPICCD